ncbi:PHP domain-containing protein [Fictibacillus iocasae]|uniref:PHP domain-containing protein n=1 Tax=Fictibacillus iocasae TaxID=2715437 RepID=A0ABW2NRM4_9BACL
MKYDLHTHSTASDGTCTPIESVKRAASKGLAGIALTDHDTVSGIPEALEEAAKQKCFELVPGIEISTKYGSQDVHVLGYFINTADQQLIHQLDALRNVRDERNRLIINKLQQLGIAIEHDELEAKRKIGGNVGRGHIAELLIEKGYAKSIPEAFNIYLGKGSKAFQMVDRISPFEALKMIKNAGGAAVLAHPGIYGDCGDLIPALAGEGMDGLECWHPDHTIEQTKHYFSLAHNLRLIPTAGSDFHGFRNGEVFHGDLGTCHVTKEVLDMLKNAAKGT